MKYHLSYMNSFWKDIVEELTVNEPKLTDYFQAFSKEKNSPFKQYEQPVSKRDNQFTSCSPYREIYKSETYLLLAIVLSQGNLSFKMFLATLNCLSSSFLAYLINNLNYKQLYSKFFLYWAADQNQLTCVIRGSWYPIPFLFAASELTFLMSAHNFL